MSNADIRADIQRAGVKHWQVSDQLNLHEGNFSRMLRKELSEEKKKQVREAINKAEEEFKEAN